MGRTGNLKQRMRHRRWEAGNGKHSIRLLTFALVKDQYGAEKILHQVFAPRRTAHRRRGKGGGQELFLLSAQDLVRFGIIVSELALEINHFDGDWIALPGRG